MLTVNRVQTLSIERLSRDFMLKGLVHRAPWLALALLCCVVTTLVPTQSLAIDNPEIEPNDSKAAATQAMSGGLGMGPLDTISGTTTGAGGSGAGSADYFLVKTVGAAANYYRHQLILTSNTPGHTVTIRGLSQTAGVINAGTDVTVQSSAISAPGTPANSRMIQWYGFGKNEQLYVRVTGTASTTAPYSLELTRTVVAPVVMAGSASDGSITIARGPGNANNTDFWVYNSALAAITGYGNDDPSSLTRSYTPGTYYIAMSNTNVANNLASPPDEASSSQPVMDFADCIVNSSQTTGLNMNTVAAGAFGSATGIAIKNNPFDVILYCFSVIPPSMTPPTGEGGAEPLYASNCGDEPVCFTVVVTPGQNPTSTGLSVTISLTSILGPTSYTLFDDGLNCDGAAGDLVFGRLYTPSVNVTPGTYSIPFLIRDGQDRQGTGAIQLNMVSCPNQPRNDLCSGAVPLIPNQPAINGYTFNATADVNAPNCSGSDPQSQGVWYKVNGTGTRLIARTCSSTDSFDTVLHVYCGYEGCSALTCVASGDDECGELSSASWCSELGATYYVLVKGKRAYSRGQFDIRLFDLGNPCTDSAQCLPRGACCIGEECVQQSAPVCAALGGVFEGEGTNCERIVVRTLYSAPILFPVSIPDNNSSGVTSNITIASGAPLIDDLAVGVNLDHPFAGDLTVTLTKGATVVTLVERVGRNLFSGGDGSNYAGEYIFAPATVAGGAGNLWAQASSVNDLADIPTGVYRASRATDGDAPTPDLNVFSGTSYSGTWTLRVTDRSSGNTGTLRAFRFRELTSAPICDPCGECAADFNLDGGIDGSDVAAFFEAWEAATPCSDVNGDGGIDGSDVQAFFVVWQAGGC